jgi:hypothetical protein
MIVTERKNNFNQARLFQVHKCLTEESHFPLTSSCMHQPIHSIQNCPLQASSEARELIMCHKINFIQSSKQCQTNKQPNNLHQEAHFFSSFVEKIVSQEHHDVLNRIQEFTMLNELRH